MVFFNAATKELNIKIVYYGPGLSGKTTNLQYVYNTLPEKDKGRMLSLATSDDRTLFFDFLPLELGEIQGMKTRIQLYTVPGQVYYNTTRKLVLRGCDGVVFVADSQKELMTANKESLENLRQNLIEQGDDLNKIPMVVQYNKRDLKSASPIEELKAILNREGRPDFEVVATEGKGVFQTLKQLIKMTFKKIAVEQGINLSIKVKDESFLEKHLQTAEKPQIEPSIKKAEQSAIQTEIAALDDKSQKISFTIPGKPTASKETQQQPSPGKKELPDDFSFVTNADHKVPDIEKKEKTGEKKSDKIRMGYDKELDDISPAASAYRLEFTELTREQEEVEMKAAERSIKSSPQPHKSSEEPIKPKTEHFISAEELISSKSDKANPIADEIRVELSNNEVSIDQTGIRIPVKIRIPKSMQNLNLRFDMQIIVEEEEGS
jgi:signal recognition particle receptor subunit beta